MEENIIVSVRGRPLNETERQQGGNLAAWNIDEATNTITYEPAREQHTFGLFAQELEQTTPNSKSKTSDPVRSPIKTPNRSSSGVPWNSSTALSPSKPGRIAFASPKSPNAPASPQPSLLSPQKPRDPGRPQSYTFGTLKYYEQ